MSSTDSKNPQTQNALWADIERAVRAAHLRMPADFRAQLDAFRDDELHPADRAARASEGIKAARAILVPGESPEFDRVTARLLIEADNYRLIDSEKKQQLATLKIDCVLIAWTNLGGSLGINTGARDAPKGSVLKYLKPALTYVLGKERAPKHLKEVVQAHKKRRKKLRGAGAAWRRTEASPMVIDEAAVFVVGPDGPRKP